MKTSQWPHHKWLAGNHSKKLFLLALKMVLMCPYKFMHPSFGGREWGCRRCVKSWRCGRLSTWELVLGSLARSCWGSCDETHFTACISGGKSEYVWIQNDLWYCVFHIFAMDSPNDSPVDTMAHSNWWFLYVCWDWISMTRPGFFGQFLPQHVVAPRHCLATKKQTWPSWTRLVYRSNLFWLWSLLSAAWSVFIYTAIYIYGGFLEWGYPKMDGLYWKIPFKWMIWGYHHFRKPPYNPCIYIYIYPTHTTRLDVANMCCWATCCNVGHQRISTESPTQSAELQTPAWPTCAVIKQACFQTILEMAKSIRFYALDITGVFKFFFVFFNLLCSVGLIHFSWPISMRGFQADPPSILNCKSLSQIFSPKITTWNILARVAPTPL